MGNLILGIMWTICVCVAMAYIYISNAVAVAEETVIHDVVLVTLISVGSFLIPGIVLIIVGAATVAKNNRIAIKGFETYGVIIKIYGTGKRKNGRELLKADVAVMTADGNMQMVTGELGYDCYKYKIGNVLLLKHYKKDIRIKEIVSESQIPGYILDKVNSVRQQYQSFGMPYFGGRAQELYELNKDYMYSGMNNPYGVNGGYGSNNMNNSYNMNNNANNRLDDPNRFKDASGSDIYGDTNKEDYYKI